MALNPHPNYKITQSHTVADAGDPKMGCTVQYIQIKSSSYHPFTDTSGMTIRQSENIHRYLNTPAPL